MTNAQREASNSSITYVDAISFESNNFMPGGIIGRFGEYYGQDDPSSSSIYRVQHCRRLECWRVQVQVQLFGRCRRLPESVSIIIYSVLSAKIALVSIIAHHCP